MTSKKRNFIDYEEYLISSLKDPEEALEYLNTAVSDEDPRVFLLALKHFLAAQGGSMPELAQQAQLNRENLYRIMSIKGNPRFSSVKSILNALGLEISIQPIQK